MQSDYMQMQSQHQGALLVLQEPNFKDSQFNLTTDKAWHRKQIMEWELACREWCSQFL